MESILYVTFTNNTQMTNNLETTKIHVFALYCLEYWNGLAWWERGRGVTFGRINLIMQSKVATRVY